MDNLNWQSIKSRIAELLPRDQHEAAHLALYIHLTEQANAMHLMYAGFEINTINKLLAQWRSSYWMLNNKITEGALLKRFPALRPLLLDIAAGQFDQAPVIVTPALETPTTPTEVETMNNGTCTRTPNCDKPAKHRGACKGVNTRTMAQASNGNGHKRALAVTKRVTPAVTEQVIPAVKPPRCHFKIEFEELLEDGDVDRIAIEGTSRTYFERIIKGLNSLIA